MADAGPGRPPSITIYTRPGCHLCDGMKAVVARVQSGMPLSVTEVDISGNAGLEAAYGLEVPVLLVDGKKAAKYRVSEADLRRLLRGRADGSSGDSGRTG